MKSILKEFILLFHKNKMKRLAIKKLKLIEKNVLSPTKDKLTEQKYIDLWSQFGENPPSSFYRLLSAINGINSYQYVPENIHYNYIEPALNNRAFAFAYNDKNFFERYLSEYKRIFPDAVLRGINGVVHDKDYLVINTEQTLAVLQILENNEDYILKPAAETGGGDNVLLVSKKNDFFIVNDKSLDGSGFIKFLLHRFSNNFILQKKLKPLSYFNDFNETSLNTVRLYAYRSVKDEEIHPFHAYIRFGEKGSLVDSSSQGGRTCGVNQNGILNNFALGKYGEKYIDLPFIEEKKGKEVPRFSEMKEIAKDVAKYFNYHRLLGFDFCVDENNNIRLLEINTLYIGVINQQMNSGPLFGEFTDEVIEYSLKNKKSFMLYFNK